MKVQELYNWNETNQGSNYYLSTDIHSLFGEVCGDLSPSGHQDIAVEELTAVANGPRCSIQIMAADFLASR